MLKLPPARDMVFFWTLVYQNLDWVREQDWEVKLWYLDRLLRGWVKIFYDEEFKAVGGIIWRPVSVWPDRLEDLWSYDEKGANLWCDFLWAPGHWDLVKAWLAQSGFVQGGWQHRTSCKVHIIDIARLCAHASSFNHLKENGARR